MANPPKSESEYLEEQARSARQAVTAIRDELMDSLSRSADAVAWTERYPWSSLGAAAAGGLAAGVAIGGMFGKSAGRRSEASTSSETPDAGGAAQAASRPQGRLASGLGSLASAAVSAAAVAATQAVRDIVKSSIYEAMHPQPAAEGNSEEVGTRQDYEEALASSGVID